MLKAALKFLGHTNDVIKALNLSIKLNLMKKYFLSLTVFLLLAMQFCLAQSYVVAGIEKTDKEDMQYEVLGKVGNHYWIYKNIGGVATIVQYNDQMQIVKQNDLSFVKTTNLTGIEFVTYPDKVFVFYQFQNHSTAYAAVATLNSEASLVGKPVVIDTANGIRPGSGTKVFNLLQSDDRQKMVLFSVNTTHANAIKVRTIVLNTNFETINEAEISINAQNKKSSLSDFALDNNGNLFCLRNTTQVGQAPAVSLLYLSANGTEVVESPIVNYSLLLDDIRLKIDNQAGLVILNSFYASTKKGNVEGLFSYVWDIAAKKEQLANANRFTDAARAVVSSKRNLRDAFDLFYLDKISTQEDGSFVAVAESADTYSNRTAFSRWDYFYGGAFYSPFMFNYWNRPFGFYPWARFGWGSPFMYNRWMNPYASFGYPSVSYEANSIALISFDKKGNFQWIKTIDKKQNDLNVDQFIGYGTIENTAGTSFVYHQKQKGIHPLVINTLTKNGELTKGNSIVLNEKNYEWMPKMLKQVDAQEAILPYQYKSRIGFAKIKFK